MKQLLQDLGNGTTSVVAVPAPSARKGGILAATSVSLISAGTERMLVDFGRSSLLGKAMRQPDRVRQAWAKVRTDGLVATWRAVRAKLAQPIPLGYCNVGRVTASDDPCFAVGQRVVSNAPHAECVSVAASLAAAIPDGVDDDSAAFTPLAAIALEGIDLLAAKPGDKFVVTGLGLIGQLAVRLLRARGLDVMGVDPDASRREMARASGAYVPDGDDPVSSAMSWTGGQGVAGVLIAASTSSDLPVSQAARSCRRRGRVVLVGVVGLRLNRADFYRNEISFQVSSSYGERNHIGPGSARRNFEEVLALMATGKLRVNDLITERYGFDEAPVAYERLAQDKKALGLVLAYPREIQQDTICRLSDREVAGLGVGLIGAGNFATATLLPSMAQLDAPPHLRWVVSAQGHQAMLAAKLAEAGAATTDESLPLGDPACRAVFICTRHDAHARQAIAALNAGKSVWVEKPLALRREELEEVARAARASSAGLMVGFNRRFAPATSRLAVALAKRTAAVHMEMVVNAGRLDPDHWTLDPRVGGGRIVGEACHFVDLARAIIGCRIVQVKCMRRDQDGQDGGDFELHFADGSSASIDYRTDLPVEVPKETIRVVCGDFSAIIHNWARLTSEGPGSVSLGWPWSRAPRKGHREALAAFLATVGVGPAPIPLEEILEVSRTSIALQSMQAGGVAAIS